MIKLTAIALALAGAVLPFTPAAAQALPGVSNSPESAFTNRILVRFRPDVGTGQAHGLIAAANGRAVGQNARIGVHVVEVPPGASAEATARAFARRAEVEFAEVDHLLAPTLTANDPYFASAWHLPKVQALEAWNTTTGNGVTVAIIDSGVDPTHPDLAAKLVAGWNFFDGNSNTSDLYGHGTAVAGTAAAVSNNGIGVTGVAWASRIMPIRVSDLEGNAYVSAIADGITWAADRGARVANVSFGASLSPTVNSAAQYMMSRGGVVIVSAGNDGSFVTGGADPYTLTISATNSTDTLTSWSTRGDFVDLGAPGELIYTTSKGGQYGPWSGTSFSAPAVAGVAALVISANPGLTGAQVQQVLLESADDRGAAGWDPEYGWGRVNAFRAVQRAVSLLPVPDTIAPSVSITSPANGATVSGTVTVGASANDNVGVASVSLFVDGALHSTDTTAPYAFSWNTAAVANGAHTLRAEAKDTAGNVSQSQVSVTVGNAATTDASHVKFLTQPSGATAGAAFTTQPRLVVRNLSGYTVTNFNGPITLSIKAGTGTSGARLLGTTTVNAVNGIATFTNLSIDLAGSNYVLQSSSPGLTGYASTAFAVASP